MKNYKNIRAEQSMANKTAWFYNWVLRILLEKIGVYCEYRSIKEFGEIKGVRVELSARGGVKIAGVRQYIAKLKAQDELGIIHIKHQESCWKAIDPDNIFSRQSRDLPGLQLADIASSAFFASVERTGGNPVKPEFAKSLEGIVCAHPSTGKKYGFGYKLLPDWKLTRFPEDQAEILKFYGAK